MSNFIIDSTTIFPFTKSEKETIFTEGTFTASKIPFSYQRLGEVKVVDYLMVEKNKHKDEFNIQEWIDSLEFGLGEVVEISPTSFNFIEKVKALETETKMYFLGEMLVETIPIENMISLAFDLSPLQIQPPLRVNLQNGLNFDKSQLVYGLKNCLDKVEEHKDLELDQDGDLKYLSLHFDLNLMKELKLPFINQLMNMLMIYEENWIFQSQNEDVNLDKNINVEQKKKLNFDLDLNLVDFFYKENLKRNEEHFVIYINVKEIFKQPSLVKKLLSYEKHYFVKTSKKKSHLKLVQ